MKKKSIIVVKAGTGTLFGKDGRPRPEVFTSILEQVHQLQKEGMYTVVVSSGAIASAKAWMRGKKGKRRLLAQLQAPSLAAIGQPMLMAHWMSAGATFHPPVPVAQILVTGASIENNAEWINTNSVIEECWKCGVIPVVNYNDAVSFAAIRILLGHAGDNDKLAATFATALHAQSALFLTEAGGVHTDNPANGGTQRFQEIYWKHPPHIDRSTSSHGRGGMNAKVNAAIECFMHGVKRVAISGLTQDVIIRFAAGERVPTMIGNKNLEE